MEEKEKIIEYLKLFTAMKLYEGGNLSLGKDAALAGKSEEEFMETLSEH